MNTSTTHIKTDKQLVPALRFKEFEGDWGVSKLGDYCKFSQGIQVDVELQSREPKDGYVKFLRIENYTQKSQDFRYIPIDVAGEKRIKKDEIAVVRYGATAGFISKGFDGALANNLFKVIPDEERFTLPFLYEHLNSHRAFSFFQSEMSGGAMPALSFGIVKALKVPLTSLPEQQKIASFLSAVDEKIQQLTKKKALLEQYKKGVMQQLFSQKLRFKDENGNPYPDREEYTRLGDLTYKVGKKNKENVQYPIYSINNQEGFKPQSEQFDGLDSNDRGYDISLYKIVESETFAYNPARINVGSIGYSYDLEKVIVSSLYVCFKTTEKLEDLFLLIYLDTYNFHKDILRYEEGGVRQYLFYENFSHIKVPLPSVEEQQKIATYLSSIDTKIERVNNQITQTQTFKKGLLQQMFV